MKIYRNYSEYTGDGIVDISSYPMREMPKLKNILNSGQIDSSYFKADTGSVYLKNKNPEEYYKISPYEIDNGIYGKIDLNTSFNDSYYQINSPITLNTKNEYMLMKIVPPKIGSYDIQSNKISYGNGYEYDISKGSFTMEIADSYSNIHDEYFLTKDGSIKYVSKHNIYSGTVYLLSINDSKYEYPDGTISVTRRMTLSETTNNYSIDIGYRDSDKQVAYIIGNSIHQDRYDKYQNESISKNILDSSSAYSPNIFNDESYEMYSGSDITVNLPKDSSISEAKITLKKFDKDNNLILLSETSILDILGIENNDLSTLEKKVGGNFFTEGIFLFSKDAIHTKTIYFCKINSFNTDDSSGMYKLYNIGILLIPILFDDSNN